MNFLEPPTDEVRRTPLPRTRVNKGHKEVPAFAKAHPHEPLQKIWHTPQPRCTLLEIDLWYLEVALKVLVVGAGPAGATTALLLARYGIDVMLLERDASFERVFRGEGLMPLGIDALFQMGLRGALESVPYRLVCS